MKTEGRKELLLIKKDLVDCQTMQNNYMKELYAEGNENKQTDAILWKINSIIKDVSDLITKIG